MVGKAGILNICHNLTKKIPKNLMFRQKLLLPCTLVFNIPTKTLQLPHADLLETTQLEKGNFSRNNSQTRFKRNKNTEKKFGRTKNVK